MDKVDSFTYHIEPFDEDFTGRLSLEVLGKRILGSAFRHADARGFEHVEANGATYLWVLSRMVIEMDEWPRTGEEFTVSTWVRRFYRYFTDRCFDIRLGNGKVVGRVLTIWAMINADTRRPADLADLFGDTFNPWLDTERPCDVERFGHIRVEDHEPAYSRIAHYSDLDINGHVNSIRYIEFVLDAFPKYLFLTHQVSRVEIAYNAESYCDDRLSFHVGACGDDRYNVIIRKNEGSEDAPAGDTVCHCSVSFAPIKTE